MKRRFIVYGILGWCMEIAWTGLGSFLKGDLRLLSITYLWMFPIYGMAVFLEPLHNRIRKWPVILRGAVYMVVIFDVEYISGGLLKLLLGTCPWDYSKCVHSINGLIRLDFIPVWFTVGLLFEKVHDMLLRCKLVIK